MNGVAGEASKLKALKLIAVGFEEAVHKRKIHVIYVQNRHDKWAITHESPHLVRLATGD